MATAAKQADYTFQGFENPTTTPVPDIIFDELMTVLTDAELRVLLYIVRRTFGFKKTTDNISLKQMVEGIRTKEGRVLDSGAGISKASAARGIKGLIEKGIIIATRNRSLEKGDEPTTYSLRFKEGGLVLEKNHRNSLKDKPVSHNETGGCIPLRQGGVSQRDTQQTVLQQTVIQHDDDDICTALENFGISPKIAIQLAKNYPAELVLEKLDLVQWLVDTKSPLVNKNPQGFLIKALENGYLPKPPKGYKSPSVRKKEEEKQQQELEQQSQAQEQFQRAREEARQRVLEQHPPQPIENTDLTTESAWSKALEALREQVPPSTYAGWLKETLLVRLENNTAFVLVASQFARDYLERRLYASIARTLEDVLRYPVKVEFVVRDSIP